MKDSELVEKVQQGEDKYYNLLVERHWDKIVGLCYKFVKDPDDAEDLAQQTFFKAFVNLDNFKGHCAFSTWVYRIAVNNSKNFLMRKVNRVNTVSVTPEDLEGNFVDYMTPEEEIHTGEVKEFFQETVMNLPEEMRAVFILADYHKLKYQDIAVLLDIKLGTVRSRLFKARSIVNDNYDEWRNQ